MAALWGLQDLSYLTRDRTRVPFQQKLRVLATGPPGKSLISLFLSKIWVTSENLILLALSRREEGEGNGTPLQYSCLEDPIDGGAWWAAVHGVTKSWTRLSDFTFTHWRRKWQPTPVFLPGEESQGQRSLVGCRLWGRRVGHDWSDLAAAAAVEGKKYGYQKEDFYLQIIKSFLNSSKEK